MSDQLHPTNPDWVLFDPEIKVPPTNGEVLLLVTEGGILTTGPWKDGHFVAWGYKPKVPDSVKLRIKREST